MSALPNPFDAFAAVVMPVADAAAFSSLAAEPVVALLAPPCNAAAGPIPEPAASEGRSEQASAVDARNLHEAADASDISQIHEIFRYFSSMAEPTLDELCRRGFDVHAFMDELEELPLFLQTA